MKNAEIDSAAVQNDANPESGGSSAGDVSPQGGPLLMTTTVPELKVNIVVLQVGSAIVFSGVFMLAIHASFKVFGRVTDGGLLVMALMPYLLLAASIAVAGILFFACRNEHFGIGTNVLNWVITNIYGISLVGVTWGVIEYFKYSTETALTFSLIQMLVVSFLIFLAVP